MLCSKCGKNIAVTHICTIIGGKVTDMDLCGHCAANIGINEKFKLKNSLPLQIEKISGSNLFDNSKRCSVCGSTLDDIAETGMIGCGQCYYTFYKQLAPALSKIHGKARHCGKIPNSAAPRLGVTSELDSLKRRLSDAVKDENFELAAALRDRIHEMEKNYEY